MLLHAAHVLGLRSAEAWEADGLGASVDLPPPPSGLAVADGLSLLHASLAGADARAILGRLGLLTPEAELHDDAHGFLEQVVGLDGAAVSAFLGDDAARKLFVGVTVSLDPVLYGRLREESLRDPRVVTALGQDPSLGLKLGWLLTSDLTAASVTILDVRVGDLSFPVHTHERPPWMTALLREVGGRFGRVEVDATSEALADRLLDAALSPVPSRRRAFQRLAATLAEPPFALGRLELVRVDGRVHLAFGDALTRARQLGPGALRSVRVAVAALIDAPDVLLVEEPVPASVRDWLIACTSGPEATLEQVVFVGEAGSGARREPDRPAASGEGPEARGPRPLRGPGSDRSGGPT